MYRTSSRHELAQLLTCLIALLVFAHSAVGHQPPPPWQEPTGWPDRIIANFDADPCRGFAVTWRTDNQVGVALAQIVKASPDARFDLKATTKKARVEAVQLDAIGTAAGVSPRPFNQGFESVHYHSVSFNGLEPDTLYAWRVRGRLGCWSEWFQTRTLPTEGPISFVYFGDAQNGIRSHWSRVIRAAHCKAGDAAFFLHAGDLVDKGDHDRDWAEWFDAGGHLHAQIPSVPVVGNHEYIPVLDPISGKKKRVLTPLWRAQFTLPVVEDLPQDLHEAAYLLPCSRDVDLFVLNSAPSDFEAQAAWLDRQIEQSDAKWRIVTMHHPYFIPMHSNRLRDNAARIAAFAGVINKHEVDLVIVGHIHTYLRGVHAAQAEPARLAVGEPHDIKTAFVISSSGAKVDGQQTDALVEDKVGDGVPEPGLSNISVDRVAGNTPMFQVIHIDGEKLSFKAYTAIGDMYDEFTMEKRDGRKTLVNGKAAVGDMRLFENTSEYPGWEDLQ